MCHGHNQKSSTLKNHLRAGHMLLPISSCGERDTFFFSCHRQDHYDHHRHYYSIHVQPLPQMGYTRNVYQTKYFHDDHNTVKYKYRYTPIYTERERREGKLPFYIEILNSRM